MKICLPTNNNLGVQSEIASNFGAARWLQIIDSETMETRLIDMTDIEQRRQPIAMDLILCRGMSGEMYEALRVQGVPIYGTRSQSVAAALADYHEGDLRDLASISCCKGEDVACDGNHDDDRCDSA